MSTAPRRLGIRGRTALVFAACFLVLATAMLFAVNVLTGIGLDASIQPSTSTAPPSITAPGSATGTPSVSLNEEARRQQLLWSVVALAVTTPLAGLVGWVTARRMLRPIDAVTRSAQRISAEHFDERIGLTGPDDELQHLGDTFDELIGRLQGAFERQRRFIGDIAHELRTPLTVQRATIQIGIDPDDPAATEQAVDRLLVENRRMEALIDGLLALAVAENHGQVFVEVDLADVLEEAAGVVGAEATRRGVALRMRTDPSIIHGDQALVSRLVSNLLDNAIEYNEDGGWVEASASGGILVVENSGPVIDPTEADRLTEAFTRGEEQRADRGSHLGLGLSIVHAIVDAHDARLTLRPRSSGGLRAEIVFSSR